MVKAALRRRYISQLSVANWRGLANLVLDRTKSVGTGHAIMIMAQIRQDMVDIADEGGISACGWRTRQPFL